MEEDAARFADLDVRLENAARSIGQQPFAPPTWRGRFGAWMVQVLRRLLWWYGLPIKDALAQIGLRNREQAIRHRYLQEDVLALLSRIECLERSAAEHAGRAERLERTAEALQLQLQAEAHTREQLAAALAPLASRVSSLAVTHEKQRSDLLLQENRIAIFLREVRRQLPPPPSNAQVRQFEEASIDSVSALYAEFEDAFRGPRKLIKERQAVYVPRLIEAGAGSASAPVLDLGCGRGEWLELLADHHLASSGVDSNPAMIERCRALGIHATVGDALAHLRSLPDRSAGAVTSFHMVEHLPFETVLALLDEALRVLQSGGLLILETPNPQNVLVGCNTFWIDPTHRQPIPSQTLKFFVEGRGFCAAEVWNLQPYPEVIRLPEDPAGIAARFNDCFYGPQDYGIIALRP
jgi:ubiquinone/menaquinone biosynthesis C-methylase UbiE